MCRSSSRKRGARLCILADIAFAPRNDGNSAYVLGLKRNDFGLNRHFALVCCLSMIPGSRSGAGFFRIMLTSSERKIFFGQIQIRRSEVCRSNSAST
jgi:hypothetical protein